MTISSKQTRGWVPNPVFGPGLVGTFATLGAVAAAATLVEAALVPGLLIGGAAVLAPRLLPRDVLGGLGDRLRRIAPSRAPSAPTAHSAAAPASGEPASFDTWRALAKTITYRAAVTTVDFSANYFVIGELATAAGLSSLSLFAGPIFYFAHEAAWHFYGAAQARDGDALEENGRMRFGTVKVSRALAKTATYEVVTGVSEFGVNYLFVRDLVAAAGLTTFSIVIAPFVYYAHEKAWDYYDARQARSSADPAPELLPATA